MRALRGYTYIGLLFVVFIVGMGLSVAGHWWHMEVKRDRERELLFVGDQFRTAIASYYATVDGGQQYPKSLEDLLEDKRHANVVRHLRRIYRDPMTGGTEWKLIKEQERVIGVSSRSEDKPIKKAGFPDRYQDFSTAATYADWRFIYRQTPNKTATNPASNPPLDATPPAGTPAPIPTQQ